MHISNPPIDLELTSEEKVAGSSLHSTHRSNPVDEPRQKWEKLEGEQKRHKLKKENRKAEKAKSKKMF